MNINVGGSMSDVLIHEAFHEGYKSYPKYASAPYLNKEFMSKVPNCNLGDNDVHKIRVEMYKNYINGWTKASLDYEEFT
jgi:hypothetical protein